MNMIFRILQLVKRFSCHTPKITLELTIQRTTPKFLYEF